MTSVKRESRLHYEPIRMTFGFVTSFVRGKLGLYRVHAKIDPLTPERLQEYTQENKDLFPRPWTLAVCRYALEHPEEIIPISREEKEKVEKWNKAISE